MAALWWHSGRRQLSAGQPINSFRQFAANTLTQHGFSDARANDAEAAAGKNGCWVSIAHLGISGSTYWEVVMASGDNGDATKATMNEAVQILGGIRQFD